MPKKLPSDRIREIEQELKDKYKKEYGKFLVLDPSTSIIAYLDEQAAKESGDFITVTSKPKVWTEGTVNPDGYISPAEQAKQFQERESEKATCYLCKRPCALHRKSDATYVTPSKAGVNGGPGCNCRYGRPCIVHAPPPQPKPHWKPQEFGSYWFVNTKGQVHKTQKTFKNDLEVIAFGNCFPTRDKAKAAAQAIRELLMKIHGE